MPAVSNGARLSPVQRERKAIRMLETRARNLEGAKAGVDEMRSVSHREKIQGALDEAAAILRDAAEVVRRGEEE